MTTCNLNTYSDTLVCCNDKRMFLIAPLFWSMSRLMRARRRSTCCRSEDVARLEMLLPFIALDCATELTLLLICCCFCCRLKKNQKKNVVKQEFDYTAHDRPCVNFPSRQHWTRTNRPSARGDERGKIKRTTKAIQSFQ